MAAKKNVSSQQSTDGDNFANDPLQAFNKVLSNASEHSLSEMYKNEDEEQANTNKIDDAATTLDVNELTKMSIEELEKLIPTKSKKKKPKKWEKFRSEKQKQKILWQDSPAAF